MAFILGHCPADALHHVPGRYLRDAYVAAQLVAGQAFPGVDGQGDRQEPFLERYLGFLHDRAGKHVEAAEASVAVPAANAVILPLAAHAFAAAMGATGFFRPADGFQMGDAGFLVGEFLDDGKEVNVYLLLLWGR